MTEQDKNDSAAFQLGLENKRDIENAKSSFEQFYRESIRFQADMRNSMDMVSSKQDVLKERFEFGTAKTLKDFKSDWDEFRVQWGSKMKEDEIRDGRITALTLDTRASIEEVKHESREAKIWVMRLAIAIFAPISVGLTISFIVWAFSKFTPWLKGIKRFMNGTTIIAHGMARTDKTDIQGHRLYLSRYNRFYFFNSIRYRTENHSSAF